MRIIAGKLRGRRLISPKGDAVRPTTDKVKEAVFSMLIPYITEDTVVMDVFAGSGNLGLEAISRGVKRVFFSDADRTSLKLVKDNVNLCGVSDQAILLAGDFRSNIRRVKEPVDIFLMDPPYAAGFILPALDTIEDAGNIAEGGIVVCEHSKKDEMPEEYRSFKKIKERTYGAISVSFYSQEK